MIGAPEPKPVLGLEHDPDSGQWTLHLDDGFMEPVRAVLAPEMVQTLAQQAVTAMKGAGKYPDLQVQVTANRWTNMGDHAQFVDTAVACTPDMTVAELLEAALDMGTPYARPADDGDRVTIQVVKGTWPEAPSIIVGADPPEPPF